MDHTDIVISGGGIGGAVLAALLVQGGRTVIIVERGTGPPPFLRPEVLWPPAIQTLERIRPLEFWERDCLRRAGALLFQRNGKRRAFVSRELITRAGVQPYFEHPNNLRETMLTVCGADVRRGVEVTGLLRDGSRVSGISTRQVVTGKTEEITAGLTVGDDGAQSSVRSAAGIACALQPFPVEFFAAGLPWPAEWPADEVRLLLPARALPSGLLGFGLMPLPGNVAAGIGFARTGAEETKLAGDFTALVAENPDTPPALAACGFPAGFKRIGRSFGLADTYGTPGCVLIGDAIHPVSPAGGQGANMAIGDAACLARLILENCPDPAAALLEHRRAAHRRGLRPTRLASAAFKLSRIPGAGLLTRGALALLLTSESLRMRMLHTLAQP